MWHSVIKFPLLLCCDSSPAFPCFLWPWQVWRTLVSYFVESLSVWVCLMFFLMSFLKLQIFWKDHHRAELLFLSLHTGVHYFQVTFPWWYWPWLLGEGGPFVRLLHSEVIVFPFLHSILWKPDAQSRAYQGLRRIKFHLLEGQVCITYLIHFKS